MGRLLNKKEQVFFDKINSEVYNLAGAENTILWSWHKYFGPTSGVSGFVDCLYGEPIAGTKHYIPFKLVAYFEKLTQSIETTDEGKQDIKEGRVFVSRKLLEKAKVPVDSQGEYVNSGDIFEFFRKGKRFFVEVKNTERDGYINDQDIWTQYICDVVAYSGYAPDRKLEGST